MIPAIIKTINSFKKYWVDAIALVNQMAVPALQQEYGMTTMDNDALLASYVDLLANFVVMYPTMQKTMKGQADSLVAMQGQLANIQQFCMTVGQQPPSSIYAPAQQQCMFNNCNKCNKCNKLNKRNKCNKRNKRNSGSQGSGQGFPQQPTMSFGGMGGGQQQRFVLPLPTSVGKIGATATSMAGMWTTLTPVQRVVNQDPLTTQTRAAPTSWADWSPECTRPYCPWLAAALYPIVAPKSSSTCSNIHPLPTTQLKAQPCSNQPLPRSLVECHQPAAPTASR